MPMLRGNGDDAEDEGIATAIDISTVITLQPYMVYGTSFLGLLPLIAGADVMVIGRCEEPKSGDTLYVSENMCRISRRVVIEINSRRDSGGSRDIMTIVTIRQLPRLSSLKTAETDGVRGCIIIERIRPMLAWEIWSWGS